MVQETNGAAPAVLARIDELIAVRGENIETMAEVGNRLRELAADPEFREDSGEDAVDLGMSTMRVVARGANGTRLETFDERAWFPRDKASVHWHNYWQVLLLARGNWQDTV
jgi:hypothetical protein